MREIFGIAGVPFIRRETRLIGSRIGDGTHQLPQIEFMVDEVLGHRVEQGRIARRIGGADVVHRLDDPSPKEVAPDTIGRGLGEEWIVF